ncbi:MAG: histidine phosphatase family protein [Acidimicrobiales bacterium]
MLFLLRHGQSEANAAGLLVGRSDPVLTSLGVRQAHAAGKHLAGERRDARDKGLLRPLVVISSPLQRARTTAEIVASECLVAREVGIDDRLIELDYGDLEGFRVEDVAPGDWAAWRASPSWRPPNGETLDELYGRVVAWCEEIAVSAMETDLIAVTHVSPIKAATSWAVGTGPEITWRLFLGTGSVTRIATSPPSLHSFGETGHLAGVR